jgi:hypothetical protein
MASAWSSWPGCGGEYEAQEGRSTDRNNKGATRTTRTAAGARVGGNHSSPRGRGGEDPAYGRDPREDEFSAGADAAIKELLDGLAGLDSGARQQALRYCQRALQVCAEHALHPLGFATRCAFVVWVEGTNHEHMEQCRDPRCDWACCRLARGWSPARLRAAQQAARTAHRTS